MKYSKTNLLAGAWLPFLLIPALLHIFAGTGAAFLLDNGDGTVVDTVTCLQWQQATMDRNGDGVADSMFWEQALAMSENLTLAGHEDWRLPDINELLSIVDNSLYDPSIDSAAFPSTVSFLYWSSTTNADYIASAWLVYFLDGSVRSDHKRTFGYYVRAVRGGQCGSLGYSVISASAGVNGSLDSGTPSPQTVPNGSATQFIFNASTGYYVATVTGCGVSYSNSDRAVSSYTATTGIITSDCTVFAKFKSFPWIMFLPAITNIR